MTSERTRSLVGVLGGMGPLASAEFVRTIYRLQACEREQDAPRVLLLSDPAVPDRTTALLGPDDGQALLASLSRGIETLRRAGADPIVVCCLTIHAVADRLPAELRAHLVSLLDIALAEAEATPGTLLVACTTGTRRHRLFERHPSWPRIAKRTRFLEEADQESLHRSIYRVKSGRPVEALSELLREMVGRYRADAVVAGCTELHLVSALGLDCPRSFPIVDPLISIARGLTEDLHATGLCA